MEFYHRDDQTLKSLVELGAKGYFPLFELSWIDELRNVTRKLTGNEKVKAKQLFKRIIQHKSLDRKKTILISMPEIDRKLFVKAFLAMVEGKILDCQSELH